MNVELELLVRALFIGVGTTVILDLWSVLLSWLGVPKTNWGLVGRWIGHFPRGRFSHENIAAAAPIRGEAAIGWITHYAIGVIYAGALIAIVGLEWARQPSLTPPLIFGIATIVAPFFIMQPGMGMGVAASKTPNPTSPASRAWWRIFCLGSVCSAPR